MTDDVNASVELSSVTDNQSVGESAVTLYKTEQVKDGNKTDVTNQTK